MGVTVSPRPSIQDGALTRQTGTSEPIASAQAINLSESGRRRQRWIRPRKVAAASADPPPIPEATGKFLVRTISAPRPLPSAAQP